MRGFPDGIFCPCTLWTIGPPGPKSCWDAAAAAVSQKVDILARELYLEFSGWIRTHMGALRTLRPGSYTVFRSASGWHSGLAWGAIFQKIQNRPYIQNKKPIFLEHVPKMVPAQNVLGRIQLDIPQTNQCLGVQFGIFSEKKLFKCPISNHFL